MDHYLLQIIWFLLIGVLLVGYSILDGFDLGVGVLHLFNRSDHDRRVGINAIGPVWDGNEVWLLTGGGALFAAFPPVYATVFEGFYLALMLVLLGLIFRAVSIEFRHQVESPKWQRTWDVAFSLGSMLPALLFGVALGNILRGIPINEAGEFTGTFLGLLHPYALLVGLAGLSWFTMHGAIWLGWKSDGELRSRMVRTARFMLWPTVALVAAVMGTTPIFAGHLMDGVWMNPLTYVAKLALIGAVVFLPSMLRYERFGTAFTLSALFIAGLWGLVGIGLFPRLVPSLTDPAYSLTVTNASSSGNTLTAMLLIALIGVPLVLAYTILIYRKFAGKVVIDESSY